MQEMQLFEAVYENQEELQCVRVIADGWMFFFFGLLVFASLGQISGLWSLPITAFILVYAYVDVRVPILSGDLFSDMGDKTSQKRQGWMEKNERLLSLYT